MSDLRSAWIKAATQFFELYSIYRDGVLCFRCLGMNEDLPEVLEDFPEKARAVKNLVASIKYPGDLMLFDTLEKPGPRSHMMFAGTHYLTAQFLALEARLVKLPRDVDPQSLPATYPHRQLFDECSALLDDLIAAREGMQEIMAYYGIGHPEVGID